ncbi:transmembrane 14C [Labeo rohita]|uniref:Transmembrane protein 14C n=1 Tax=Labeo rohita TaxID=84645 RepID=A0A498NDR0_LABRO|nr:transmembrane 14C [Labeo rohita]
MCVEVLMMAVDWAGYGYAALVASGGVIGYVKAAASGTLAGIMGKRFYNSRKIVPAGLIAGASILMLAKLGAGMLQKPQQS